MLPFTQFIGTAVPVRQDNVDTDQLLPKQFLTAVTRQGFGRHLFHDWRYLDSQEQQPNPDFVLNQPQFSQAQILLCGTNFGCGSSREHAPWALADYGFRVIIAVSFADIFYRNCINNQILPITLGAGQVRDLMDTVSQNPSLSITIDLPQQSVSIASQVHKFEIAEADKANLIGGLDRIGQTLQHTDQIAAYESARPAWLC